MSAPDTLLMWSGGLDSTAALWQRVERGLPTRVHHVVLSDMDGRADAELAAVRAIRAWLDERGYGPLVEYSESAMDFGPSDEFRGIPNINALAVWAGFICATPRGRAIRTIIHPYHADCDRREVEIYENAYRRECAGIAYRAPQVEYPLAGLRKRDIAAQLPAELLALCSWCRTPQSGQACHRCGTCRLMDAALGGRR